jgi:hypothetical protein
MTTLESKKDLLKKVGLLGIINPKELENFQEWVEYLESILTGPFSIFPDDGEMKLIEIKARVATFRGLTIEIFPNEHVPPHFHVKSHGINASFRIKDCSILDGEIKQNDYDKICFWYNTGAKDLLIEVWNKTRPTNCIAGNYQEK